jgi:hypothetical protein
VSFSFVHYIINFRCNFPNFLHYFHTLGNACKAFLQLDGVFLEIFTQIAGEIDIKSLMIWLCIAAALPPSDFMLFATIVKDVASSELSKIVSIESCLAHRPELLKLLHQSGFFGVQPELPRVPEHAS